jgi:hypothetical protein
VADDDAALVGLARALRQLLVGSYGMYPTDLAAEVAEAGRHLGASETVVLLADYDQLRLVGFDRDDDRSHAIDDPGPGEAFRHERAVEERLDDGRRRLWVPVKDSAERLGVLGVVDDGSVAAAVWEPVASLIGELVVSKMSYGDHITLRRRTGPFSLAAEMRWALLPPLTFTGPDVTIAGFLQPSHGIAGDAFDYSVTGRQASMAIFDAMGHGMEASRMANVTVAAYRNARRSGLGPAAALRRLDEVISAEFGGSRFVTAQAATLDLDTGALELANAGHPPPLLLRTGEPAAVAPCPASRPAGLRCEPSTSSIRLGPGDAILFRTDGMVEVRSPDGEFFGDERLAAIVDDLLGQALPPAEVLRRTVHAVVDHRAGREGDDATLLLVRWNVDEARPVT